MENTVPGDNATLDEWIEFTREYFPESPFLAEHLETLAKRDGGDYRVGFSTKDFFLYLDAYKVGVEQERAKKAFDEEAGL